MLNREKDSTKKKQKFDKETWNPPKKQIQSVVLSSYSLQELNWKGKVVFSKGLRDPQAGATTEAWRVCNGPGGKRVKWSFQMYTVICTKNVFSQESAWRPWSDPFGFNGPQSPPGHPLKCLGCRHHLVPEPFHESHKITKPLRNWKDPPKNHLVQPSPLPSILCREARPKGG